MNLPADSEPAAALRPLQLDVVSVQSQVVYGRVGNNVAMHVFAERGLLAAAVPTVLLSNTPHYPSMHGGAVPADWFAGWLEDLVARDSVRQLRLVQMGYLGVAPQAEILVPWVQQRLQAADTPLRVHIDPVIGDHDVGVYVDPALVDIYRQQLLPLADGITPNGFELSQLAQAPVDTMDQVVAAARRLLQGRLQWVVATSAAPASWPAGRMKVALISADGHQVVEHPRVDAAPKGTGDLFSATLSAELLAGQDLETAVRKACQEVTEAVELTRRERSQELLLPVRNGQSSRAARTEGS